MGQCGITVDALVSAGVHMNASTSILQHAERRTRHRKPIHPVKRLGEADHPVGAETGRQFLGTELEPLHIADPSAHGLPLAFGQHVAVGVDTGRLLKPRCQQQREVAGTTADVEQPAGAVEHHSFRECVRQCDRITDPTDRVVARTPRIQQWMPSPAWFDHSISIAFVPSARQTAARVAMSQSAAR
jgi:hypothetical protein